MFDKFYEQHKIYDIEQYQTKFNHTYLPLHICKPFFHPILYLYSDRDSDYVRTKHKSSKNKLT
jgi:hypothetical protein